MLFFFSEFCVWTIFKNLYWSCYISSILCVHSDLHTLAELFFKYAQRASILDMSLHYSVPRCGGLSRSLLSLGYLLRCYFLNEAFPHTLFKMALPLSLFLIFFFVEFITLGQTTYVLIFTNCHFSPTWCKLHKGRVFLV